MTLSIIIVNYNVKYYLEQCLHSVWKAVEGIDNEVFVVDNASKDDSVAYLKTKFPQQQYPNLHIIANRHNLGFGKANNLALKKATGEFILFLNPDTILTEHTLHDCFCSHASQFRRLRRKNAARQWRVCFGISAKSSHALDLVLQDHGLSYLVSKIQVIW